MTDFPYQIFAEELFASVGTKRLKVQKDAKSVCARTREEIYQGATEGKMKSKLKGNESKRIDKENEQGNRPSTFNQKENENLKQKKLGDEEN